ncbi:MAG: hypothetical protein ABMA13_10295 [Chthoniobacteraceae bacterium]
MAENFYDFEDEELQPRRKDNLFLWTVLILLLIGAAFACWLGSFYIFGHPEEARCYAILMKLKKIEQLRRFDVTQAPQGEFLSAQRAFEKFSTLTRLELERENAELLRIYIKNYTETKKLVPYLRGKFDVMQADELTAGDLFPMGTVALMQPADYAQVVVEHLFPATGPNLEMSRKLLVPGYPFSIEKTNDVTAIIHVERLADGRMLLTVAPLHYPSYALKGGAGTFASEPPLELNIAAGLPISRGDKLNDALKRFAQMRAGEPAAIDPKSVAKGPELVRIDTVLPGTVAPESGVIPEPPVARAEPVRPGVPTPRMRAPITELTLNTRTPAPLPVATPLPVVTMPATPVPLPVPAPPAPVAVIPPPVVVVPPEPAPELPPPPPAMAPPAISPSGVPLKPFVQSNSGIAPPGEMSGTWRLYPPGGLPAGRTISSTEALDLVGVAGGADRIYLSGNFVVTARGDNKAVLRPKGEPLPPGSAVRIIAEFPGGALPPDEGEVFARDASRSFEVRAITRADDGQTVNIFVREVTR